MRWFFIAFLGLFGSLAQAETVVPIKTIRANTILSAADLTINTKLEGQGISTLAEAIGMESRVVLYAGRPIRPDDIGPPAVVTRNQLLPIHFQHGALAISTTGRALDRGAVGETIRVMNVSSRATLFGRILPDGSIQIAN
ncbi:MAG: flagellar basal body P-ring formation chaperone FlgA [Paracoccaceae bacterium]